MPGLRFRLFGKFTAHHDAGLLKGIEASKDQELLSYLLFHRDRHLHAALNSDNGHGTHVLLVDHDWLSLNPCSNLWTDVADFERAFAGAEGIAGRQLDAEKADALREAVSLYNDDLLPGYYQDWILFERELDLRHGHGLREQTDEHRIGFRFEG